MDVTRDLAKCPDLSAGAVVTIGAYDGVHRGHQEVIRQVRARAQARGAASVVLTFDRHPASVVRPESAPLLLTDLEQKIEALAATGIDHTVVLHFDEERSAETAEHFVQSVLAECLQAREIVVGDDFHFGHQRKGNVELLSQMGRQLGFEVVGLELVSWPGIEGPVSSTAIRRALGAGDLARAELMLGRPYDLRGLVVDGDKMGRELGFPTANVRVPSFRCLPADGIYAGWYESDRVGRVPSAISLGHRPTFYEDGSGGLLLEAHLIDFDGDLYGDRATVEFASFLRGQEKFDGVDALVAQIAADVDRAREMLVGA